MGKDLGRLLGFTSDDCRFLIWPGRSTVAICGFRAAHENGDQLVAFAECGRYLYAISQPFAVDDFEPDQCLPQFLEGDLQDLALSYPEIKISKIVDH